MKTHIGHYELVAEIGRGGMGVVYKGYEPALARYVAIKELSPALAHDALLVERFLREARSMAALNDPHIIQIYFIGQDDEQPFFVMEFVDGESLSGLLKREGRLKVGDALAILRQAAQGLAVAHDRGVIHRDIKPGNLMISQRGQVKLADFGIALANQDLDAKLTGTGEFVGTPGYLSPEVCLGKPVDQRSDIFALGIVLFEMLTGRMPFSDESPLKLMLEVVQADVPDVRALNAEVDAETARILARMLAKEPSARYQNAHELIEDLARHPSLLQGGALSFKPAPAKGAAATLIAASTPATASARSRSSTLPPVVASGATVHRDRVPAAPPPSSVRRQWPLWGGAGLLAIAASLGWVFRDALFDQASPGIESIESAEPTPTDTATPASAANANANAVSGPLQSPLGAMPPGAEDRRGRLRGALTERMQDPAARALTAPVGFHTFAVEGIGDPALILPAKRRIEEKFVAAGLEKTSNLLRADVVIVVRADAVETQEGAQPRDGAPVSVDFSVRPFSRGRAIDPGFEQTIRYTAINAESKVERLLNDKLDELIKDLQE